MYEIDKTFSFCYGHRVFGQIVDTEFSERGHTCAKCRQLHGHEGLVQVFLESDTLNEQGMVFDFVNIGWIKNFLDDNLDHKFIVSFEDPWFDMITGTSNTRQNLSERPERLVTKASGTRLVTKVSGTSVDVVPVFVPGTKHVAGWHVEDTSMLEGPEREVVAGFFMVDFVPTSENLSKWLFECVDAKMSGVGVKVSKISWNETPKSRAVYKRPE